MCYVLLPFEKVREQFNKILKQMKAFFEELLVYGHESTQRLWEGDDENSGQTPEKSIPTV